MRYTSSLLFSLCLFINVKAQTSVRSIEQLTADTSGWTIVKEWVSSAKNKVEVLKADQGKGAEALHNIQITTRSPMGAIIYFTGGILVDNGWVRILGSGSNAKLTRSLPEWNKGKSFNNYGEKPPFLLVADDAVGGYFAINGGALGADTGMVYYLSPDNLNWESMHFGYSDFINFCFSGDINTFYADMRWKNWKQDLAKLSGNQVYNFYPYPWTAEGKDINKSSRGIVPTEEQYLFNMDARKQLGKK
jgi:hypothetical protein